jgi:hypothetical protein
VNSCSRSLACAGVLVVVAAGCQPISGQAEGSGSPAAVPSLASAQLAPGSSVAGISASATPAATQWPTSSNPAARRFSSAINGIQVDVPDGWETRVATERWTRGPLGFDSPAADVIFEPTLGDRLYLVMASQPYGDGSADAWRNEAIATVCPTGGGFSSLTVDGARALSVACGPNGMVLVLTETRGYVIRLVASSDEPGLAGRYNWDWLKQLLKSVDLRPNEAAVP